MSPPEGSLPPGLADIRRQLLAVFRDEHQEHLAALRPLVDTLATGDRLLTDAEWMEIQRRVHTLKGAARAVDLEPIERLTHELETRLLQRQHGALSAGPSLAAAIHRVLDASELVMAGQGGSGEEIPADALAAVDQALTVLQTLESEPPVAPQSQPRSEAAPPQEPPPPPTDTPESPEETPVAAETSPLETVRVSVGLLDDLAALSGQLTAETDQRAGVDAVAAGLRELERRLETLQVEHYAGASGGILAALPDLLTETRRLRQLHREATYRTSRLAGDLFAGAHRARLMQASTIAEGFGRMLRDLARDAGREVTFRIDGGETPVERATLQALRDPLLHLLRNTVSHGIEPPDVREAQGKSRAGLVILRFSARGNRLVVTVEDDGQGIDFARVRKTAVEQNLLSEAEAERLRDADLAPYLFHPGFSTSDVTDALKGRGMGLSVVADAVARFHGHASARANPQGRGSRFTLTLPLSLSSQRLVLVRTAGQIFGLPVFAVQGLRRASLTQIEALGGVPHIRLDDDALGDGPIPVEALSSLLSLRSGGDAVSGALPDTLFLALLSLPGRGRLAIVVDNFEEETEVIVTELSPYVRATDAVSGSFLRADGSVALALHAGRLLERGARMLAGAQGGGSGMDLLREEAERRRRTRPRTILVVDDSVTTRTLERSVLEANGYQVRLAVDGAEALTLLRTSQGTGGESPDLVISDVEMPHMDGFTLLEEMKRDPRLALLPFILVTSRESPEDRERGLLLGADAYIVKRRFEQGELLAVIEQLIA